MPDQPTEEQKRIVQLELENETLKKDKANLVAEVTAKGKALDESKAALTASQNKAAESEKQNAALKATVAAKDKELEQAAGVVSGLKDELAQKAFGTVELPTVKVGKDTYELVGGNFFYSGREVSIEVLKEDAKLAAELVKEGFGGLRKLEDKK